MAARASLAPPQGRALPGWCGMSFLSRKNSQPDRRRGRGAAEERADSEYDDYGYAPDAYQDDDAWSPDEYFSPEGIKGRWAAGTRPGERPGVGVRGRRASQDDRDGGRGYDEPGARYDDSRYDDHDSGPQAPRGRAGAGAPAGYGEAYPSGPYQPDGYGQDGQYENEDYGTGAFDLTEDDGDDTGARPVRGDRGGRPARGGSRRRRDRADKGERTGRLRQLGRRDRDPDIWPDDGVSDEDYWASVAADRPFNSANGDLDADPQHAADSRPMGRPAADRLLGSDRPMGADRGLGADRPVPGDPRIAGEPRIASEHRTGSGRLGPPPGLSPAAAAAPGAPGAPGQNGYVPAPTPTPSGPQGRSAQGGPGMGDRNSGPMARSGTGPNAFRPSTGPAGSRPGGARQDGARPAAGLAQPSFSQSQPGLPQPGLPQPGLSQPGPAQPSFQPNGARHAARRPDRADRSDWPERPERPERPDRRGGPDWADRTERIDRVDRSDWADRTERIDRVPAAGYPDPRLNGRAPDGRVPDGRVPDSRALNGRAPDNPGHDSRGSGMWNQDFTTGDFPSPDTGSQGRSRRVADDDPLTSKAYSRSALTDTDGRSYRVAHRSRVPDDRREAALNEATQTFSTTGSYEADPQAARYPGHGGQQSGQNPYDRGGNGSYPYPNGQPYPARPAREHDDDRYRSPRPAGYGNNGHHGRR